MTNEEIDALIEEADDCTVGRLYLIVVELANELKRVQDEYLDYSLEMMENDSNNS